MAVLALVPKIAPGTKASRAVIRSRRTSSGSAGGGRGARPRRLPQSGGYGAYAPPPATPFQPGAPPQPPLGLPFAAAGALVLLLQSIWEALNQRPAQPPSPGWPKTGNLELTSDTPRTWHVDGTVTSGTEGSVCSPPVSPGPSSTTVQFGRITCYSTTRIRIQNLGQSAPISCTEGANIGGYIGVVEAFYEGAGWFYRGAMFVGGIGAGGLQNGRVFIETNPQITQEGVGPVPPPAGPDPEWLPGLQPKLPDRTDAASLPLPNAPLLLPPAVEPAPAPTQAEPLTQPAPAPAPGTAPGPAPRPAPAPAVPLPLPVPTPRPGSGAITGGGLVLPEAPPVPVPTTGPDVRDYGGPIVGAPGSPPPPTMQGIASEVGRIEQKLAFLLPIVEGINGLEVLKDLLGLLPNPVDGVTYQLSQPCGTDENGQPLEPLEVEVLTQSDSTAAIIRRLDAIAYLIDLHKQTRQPLCKGKVTGEPVTVTFGEVL